MRTIPYGRWLTGGVVGLVLLALAALLPPAVMQAREAARRSQSRNHLKSLGLALHNYHDVHQTLPPGAVVNDDGTGRHGWYIQLAPYVDAAPMFSQVNFDLDWNHPRNAHVFRYVVPWCLNPSTGPQRSADGFGMSHYPANARVFHRNSSVTLADLNAGSANTWFLGEGGGSFAPFGYPFNWRHLGDQLNSGPLGFGLPQTAGANLLLGDASVRYLSSATDSTVLRQLAAALPQPPPEEIAVPPPLEWGDGDDWSGSHLGLDADDYEGLIAATLIDGEGVIQEVWIGAASKFSVRRASNEDLRRVVEAYPAMHRLIGAPRIDDEAAKLVARLPELRQLNAVSLQQSDAVTAALNSLTHLTEVVIAEESLEEPDSDARPVRYTITVAP